MTTSQERNTVSVLMNNGNGTFATKVDYGTGSGPRSVFASDLDGDGDQDLATPNNFSNTVSILYNLSNRAAPILDSIGAKTVIERSNLSFRVHTIDPDGTIPGLTATNVPTNATFMDSGNGAGSFSFNPDTTQAGVYNITFKAFDIGLADSEVVEITVLNCAAKPGDANGSGGTPNLTDIIYLVNYVFKGGPAPSPVCRGDANASGGNANLTDIIYLVNYVFKGGPAPIKSGICCL